MMPVNGAQPGTPTPRPPWLSVYLGALGPTSAALSASLRSSAVSQGACRLRAGAALGVSPAGQTAGARPRRDRHGDQCAAVRGLATTHLVFTPMDLLERLVPLVPRPRINLLIYHGVLAPNAPWRRAVVAREDD